MAKCSQCGYENKERNSYCVNCGSVLELGQEYLKSEDAKQRTATRTWVAYFFILSGFGSVFGGLVTYATSVGTIIQGISAQVALPYILIGFVLIVIGFGVLTLKTEA